MRIGALSDEGRSAIPESSVVQTDLERIASAIAHARVVVGFTGAGISTESGIPDFRSPGGVWTRHRPITYREFMGSAEVRRRAWQLRREIYPPMAAAQPNAGHLAFAELEQLRKLDCLVTQNIDGLHQRAGSSPHCVIELHGTTHAAVCTACGTRFPMPGIMQRLDAGEEVPDCEVCGGILKSATVFFGQSVPETDLSTALEWARRADVLIAAGSSLVVHPASEVPAQAQASGAKLFILNLTPTPLDSLADAVVQGKLGQLLPELVRRVRLAVGPGDSSPGLHPFPPRGGKGRG